MAMISVTYADALIACFDAKYHYAFWRPITAIRAGDTDGNEATVGDPLVTAAPGYAEPPGVPERALVRHPGRRAVIARFLGTQQIDFTIPSLTGLGDRHFARAERLEYEVGNARIWGGIHFRSAVEDGVEIAKKTAQPGAGAPLPAVDTLEETSAPEGRRPAPGGPSPCLSPPAAECGQFAAGMQPLSRTLARIDHRGE